MEMVILLLFLDCISYLDYVGSSKCLVYGAWELGLVSGQAQRAFSTATTEQELHSSVAEMTIMKFLTNGGV